MEPSRDREPDSHLLAFSDFTFDLATGELRHLGEPVPLRPQATRALRALVEGRGRLVTRAELRHALWGERHVAWESGLHQHISQVRRALRENSGGADLIQTVARRGYRLAVPVTACGVDVAVSSQTGSSCVRPVVPIGARLKWFAFGVATVLLVPVTVLAACGWWLSL